MTEAALRLIAAQMAADPKFDRWVRTDPVRALRGFDLTAEERERLLNIDTHRDRATKNPGGETR